MALSEIRLSSKIVAIIDIIKLEEIDSEIVKQKFADALAKAIVEEIKQARATGTDSRGDQHNLTIS